MINISKRHSEEVIKIVNKSLYSRDVKAAVYTAYLLNYGYERNVHVQLDKLEYDIVDEGLFIGGKYKDIQNKTLADLCSSFYDKWIGGEPGEVYIEMFNKAYKFSALQF